MAALQSITFLALAGLPPGVFVLLLVAATVVVIAEYRRLNAISGRLTTRERRWFWRQGGLQREFQFRGELVLWRWLIVINGRDLDGRRVQLVLARDSVSGDDWRRLQAALRYSRAGAT
nr:protein YgfX [Microbulbifer celer]